ncbi:DUF3618 domain-containing protein [Baekduia soli]|uniref:DUF3618 domain-containing protein n=1 Tax=Baekduia soli TaxID=496014 RepID=A0A5B8U484_9ACTN|nr:DUF3618 domain-containing protein [Baekduia soli]QEC47906.1 DUF3618 domain-containing protein [Baekduia soli]
MGQDPDMIRRDIENTRERMGDTVDALGYKTDVKARARDSVTDRVGSVKERLVGVRDAADDATPGVADVKQGTRRAVGVAQENPLGLAIGAVAVGFLAGMLLPGTGVENDRLGPMADQVKEQLKDSGQEALEHGKAVVSETASTAVHAASQTAQEHGAELRHSAQDNAQTAREGISSR